MNENNPNLKDIMAILERTPASLAAFLEGLPDVWITADRTAQFTESYNASLSELLANFAALRRENVAALVGMNLTSADLSRAGQHPELGK